MSLNPQVVLYKYHGHVGLQELSKCGVRLRGVCGHDEKSIYLVPFPEVPQVPTIDGDLVARIAKNEK